MSVNKKVVAAISTAIGYYVQAEQEALLALQQKKLAERAPQQYSSPYMIAGRAASMEARWMWQMRLAR